MTKRAGLRLLTAVTVGWALAAGPRPAAATIFYDLTVVSSQSHLELLPGSAFVISLGAPIGTVSAALESQGGAGSTSGLSAPLAGNLRVRYENVLVFPEVHVQAGGTTLVSLSETGSFAPGLPGTPGDPAPAGWAITFGPNALGITGDVAVRELAVVVGGGGRIASVGPDSFVFPDVFPPPQLLQPAISFAIAGGFLDLATTFTGDARFALGESTFRALIDLADRPLFEVFGADLARLTIPVRASVVIPAADLGSPLPFELRLEVGGRIVAQNFGVPEPGAALLLAAALVGIAHRRVRAEGRSHA